jgi:hypothetical protein
VDEISDFKYLTVVNRFSTLNKIKLIISILCGISNILLSSVYKASFSKNLISIETSKNLGLWQVRFRTICNYNFISVGKNIQIGQLIKILRFIECGDYISKGSYIINENDYTPVSHFEWGS